MKLGRKPMQKKGGTMGGDFRAIITLTTTFLQVSSPPWVIYIMRAMQRVAVPSLSLLETVWLADRKTFYIG